MTTQPAQDGYTCTLTIDDKCHSCVMYRHIKRDLRAWDYMPDDGDLADAIAQHIERRCDGCIEGCWVEEEDGHFDIFVTTTER